MRRLGFTTSNGYTAQRLRDVAKQLLIDASHFPQRAAWTNEELANAVATSSSWAEVARSLGAAPTTRMIAQARSRAEHLGIVSDLGSKWKTASPDLPFLDAPDPKRLRAASLAMAAAWFEHRGYAVSLPVEPRPYDLLVEAQGKIWRAQVKSTRGRDAKSGSYVCNLTRTPKRDGQRLAYTSEDIDFFFIVDGQGRYYLVPLHEVAGATRVSVKMISHREVSSP